MDSNVHFITLATDDLDAVREFYVRGLGWAAHLDVPDEIVFFQVAPGLLLAFFDSRKFGEDTGRAGVSVSGLTLAHNVDSPDAVVQTVTRMRAAGGSVVKEPQEGAFGGVFHALVEDPNGVLWEIAHNPSWSIGDDGTVSLG